MKKKLSLFIRSILSIVHILVAKIFCRRLHTAFAQDFSCSTKLSVNIGGSAYLKKHIHTKRNVIIEADGGIIEIGEGCFFNNGCMIVAKEHISIGSYTAFGPNVFVYDHDHDIHAGKVIHDSGFVTAPVIIGKNVWVGANTVILRGTVIGDGCIIGAGSVIKGTYPPNTLVIQKKSEERRQLNTAERKDVRSIG